jgi:hypothetical protein
LKLTLLVSNSTANGQAIVSFEGLRKSIAMTRPSPAGTSLTRRSALRLLALLCGSAVFPLLLGTAPAFAKDGDSGGGSGGSGSSGGGSGGSDDDSDSGSGDSSGSGKDSHDNDDDSGSGSSGRREGRSDHDRARDAQKRGDVLPYARVLPQALNAAPGDVVRVRLRERSRGWTYDFTILGLDGRYTDLSFDAKTARLLKRKGR